MNNEKVDFGFKKVNREDKSGLVKEIFSGVAKKYDLMNDLMSGGVHRVWKNKMIKEVNFSKPIKVIDLAGGTGDIAFRIAKKAHLENIKYEIDVVDINQEMLDVGEKEVSI